MASFNRAPEHDHVGVINDNPGVAFAVDGEIRLDQFAHELATAHGWPQTCDLNYYTGDHLNGTWMLWVGRTDVNPQTVSSVGQKHVPNPDFVDPNYVVPQPAVTVDDLLKRVQALENRSSKP